MAKEIKIIRILPNSKGSIINQYKAQLPLPSYCWESWDSFEECFLDFIRDSDESWIVTHEHEVELNEHDKAIYFDILEEASRFGDLTLELQ